MNSPVLTRFEKMSRIWVFVLALIRGALRASALLLAGFLLFSAVEGLFALSGTAQRIFWMGLVAGSAGLWASAFLPLRNFSLKRRSKNLARRNPSLLREDDFLNAMELSQTPVREGTSSELTRLFLQGVEDKISRCRPFQTAPQWTWRAHVMFFLAALVFSGGLWAFFPGAFPLSARLFYPFGVNKIDSLIRVSPGSALIPWGGSVQVEALLRSSSLEKPRLFVKSAGGWAPVEPDDFSAGALLFNFENIVEPLVYRFQWKKEWTSTFEIIPQTPLTVKRFLIKVKNPEYTGGEETEQESPEISGLAGSEVTMEARFSGPVSEAKILFSNGTELSGRMEGNDEGHFQFPILSEGTYQFSLKTNDGQVQVGPEVFPLRVIPDEPPSLRLLSPEEDLIAGDKEIIPLTFDASDDFGVADILLHWEKSGGKGRRAVGSYSPPRESELGTFSWSLSRDGFQPGDVVRFRLEAVDGNRITGPGRAWTDWRILEIASFEASHEAIEEALEKWREETLALLADVTTKQAALEKEGSVREGMKEEFNQTLNNSQALQRFLTKIVEQMEKDPLSDYGVWLEHQAMADSFDALNKETMKNAQSALQTENAEGAQKELARAASDLERMLALSEDLSKTQRARDVLESGASLEKVGENLTDLLESVQGMDKNVPADIQKEINQLLKEAMDILTDMARTFDDFPEELPEDFINQEAMKDVNVGESKDIVQQIQDALKRGDFAAAAEMAKQFLESARKMRDSLSEAHQSFVDSHSPAQLEKEVREQSDELKKIAEAQREIMSQTSELEKKRLENLLKNQDERLADLFKKQTALNEKMNALLEAPSIEPPFLSRTRTVEGWMDAVALEFKTKKVDQAPGLLSQIIQVLNQTAEGHDGSANFPLTGGLLRALSAGEQEIFDILKGQTPSSSGFSNEDKSLFQKLKQQQKDLKQQTGAVRNKLQSLSQRTANVGVPLNQSLTGAEDAMGEASTSLDGQNSHQALGSEGQALEELMKAQAQLGEAQNAFQQMGQEGSQGGGQGGSGGGGPRILLRNGSRGQSGSQTGRVTLPRAEDYKAPKEFRKELLESLKEKFPQVYEDVIHKYFKRLAD